MVSYSVFAISNFETHRLLHYKKTFYFISVLLYSGASFLFCYIQVHYFCFALFWCIISVLKCQTTKENHISCSKGKRYIQCTTRRAEIRLCKEPTRHVPPFRHGCLVQGPPKDTKSLSASSKSSCFDCKGIENDCRLENEFTVILKS